MNKIKYTCKKCGWQASITVHWPDLKPKKCANRKCKTSFLLKPDQLLVEVPMKVENVQEEPKKKVRS